MAENVLGQAGVCAPAKVKAPMASMKVENRFFMEKDICKNKRGCLSSGL
jgi:hypothetical protein